MTEENAATNKTTEILAPLVGAMVVLAVIYGASVVVGNIDLGNIITTGNYLTQSPLPQYNLTANSIGYIGCSNTRDSVQGYYSTTGNKGLFWPPYNIGGDSIDVWANSSSTAWKAFDQEVKTYGKPKLVWFELCERADATVNNQTVVSAIRNLRGHTSDYLVVYISPLNAYNPSNMCALTGPKGVNDTIGFVNYATGTGVALVGPSMGPLNQSTTLPDLCHPNTAGMSLLGQQLVSFFDKLR